MSAVLGVLPRPCAVRGPILLVPSVRHSTPASPARAPPAAIPSQPHCLLDAPLPRTDKSRVVPLQYRPLPTQPPQPRPYPPTPPVACASLAPSAPVPPFHARHERPGQPFFAPLLQSLLCGARCATCRHAIGHAADVAHAQPCCVSCCAFPCSALSALNPFFICPPFQHAEAEVTRTTRIFFVGHLLMKNLLLPLQAKL